MFRKAIILRNVLLEHMETLNPTYGKLRGIVGRELRTIFDQEFVKNEAAAAAAAAAAEAKAKVEAVAEAAGAAAEVLQTPHSTSPKYVASPNKSSPTYLRSPTLDQLITVYDEAEETESSTLDEPFTGDDKSVSKETESPESPPSSSGGENTTLSWYLDTTSSVTPVGAPGMTIGFCGLGLI